MLPKSLSVLTFNILGIPFLTTHSLSEYMTLSRNYAPRMKQVAKSLNESTADILLLQEVHTFPLLRRLKKQLKNYPFVSFKPFVWGPRGGLVIFSKYEIESTQYSDFLTHGSFLNKSMYAKLIQNGILITKLTGSPLYILNTYVTSDLEHKWNQDSKVAHLQHLQLKQISYLINLLTQLKNEVIIGGDFNIAKQSTIYDTFLEQSQVQDVFSTFSSPTQHPEFFPQDIIAPRLDYIFATSHLASTFVQQAKQLFEEKVILGNGNKSYLSDHIALAATLVFQYTQSQKDRYASIRIPKVLN